MFLLAKATKRIPLHMKAFKLITFLLPFAENYKKQTCAPECQADIVGNGARVGFHSLNKCY